MTLLPLRMDRFTAEMNGGQAAAARAKQHPLETQEGVFLSDHPVSQVHGAIAVYGAMTEYTAEIPHALESEEPIVWVNGFGAFKKTMRGISRETAKLGHANVRFRPVRRSGRTNKEKWQDATQVHVDTLAAVVEDLSTNPRLKDVEHGSDLDFNSLVLAAHSYGGKTAVRHALAHPGQTSKLIKIETVGDEDPSLLRFVRRGPRFARKELIPFVLHHGPDFAIWDAKKAVEYMFSDPMQTLGEIKACTLADDRLAYYELHDKHVGTALITGSEDTLIPAGPIEMLAAHMVDYYERLESGHLGPQKEQEMFASGVVRAINSLNEQQKPRLSVVPS